MGRTRRRRHTAPPLSHSELCRGGGEASDRKIKLISQCLEQEPVDIDNLQRLAASPGGLLSNDIRCRAWPKLVGTTVLHLHQLPSQAELQSHRYYQQVQLDIQRCFKRFPRDMRKSRCREIHLQLSNLILTCLHLVPNAHYYQGFHDIAMLWLMAVGPDTALVVLVQVMQCHLGDFMTVDMKRTTSMMSFIYDIIATGEPDITKFLERSEVGTVFSLSWVITWFSHVIEDTSSVLRLHDFFLASHPLMSLYVTAAVVISRRQELLACECELSEVHHFLSKMPPSFAVESHIYHAKLLFKTCPPAHLGESRASICDAIVKLPAFEQKLWNQMSDTHIAKNIWRERKRQEKAQKQHEHHNSTMATPAGDDGGGRAAGEEKTLATQAKQIALYGLSASVGVVSVLLWTFGSEGLF